MKDINPTTFTLTSVVVGMIVSDDLSYPELNAFGNWLVLLGDYLLTYAAQKYVIEQKIQRNINYKKDIDIKNDLDYLYDAISKMKTEIEKIKKETN